MPRPTILRPAGRPATLPLAMLADACGGSFTATEATRAGILAALPVPSADMPAQPLAALPARTLAERLPRTTLPACPTRDGAGPLTNLRLRDAGRCNRTGETLFTVA